MIMLGVLFLCGQVNVLTLALSVSVTETVILIYRIAVIVKHRHLLKQSEEN
jgi:hypothetical protein